MTPENTPASQIHDNTNREFKKGYSGGQLGTTQDKIKSVRQNNFPPPGSGVSSALHPLRRRGKKSLAR